MALVIGIDPGKSGAIACVERDQMGNIKLLGVHDTPVIKPKKGKAQYDERLMAQIIKNTPGAAKILIEKVNAMPGQGVVSMFSFGMGFGLWLGIVTTFGVPYELVIPQRWKKEMLADIAGDDQKARAVTAAKRLFPDADLSRKKDHGRADAMLIAYYGARNL